MRPPKGKCFCLSLHLQKQHSHILKEVLRYLYFSQKFLRSFLVLSPNLNHHQCIEAEFANEFSAPTCSPSSKASRRASSAASASPLRGFRCAVGRTEAVPAVAVPGAPARLQRPSSSGNGRAGLRGNSCPSGTCVSSGRWAKKVGEQSRRFIGIRKRKRSTRLAPRSQSFVGFGPWMSKKHNYTSNGAGMARAHDRDDGHNAGATGI